MWIPGLYFEFRPTSACVQSLGLGCSLGSVGVLANGPPLGFAILSIRFSFQLFPFSTGSDLVFTFQDFMSICLFPPRGFSCYLQLLILTQSFN